MNSGANTIHLEWSCPATVQNVEQVCSAAIGEVGKAALFHKDRFAAEILIREALNNAFLHGCKQNPLLAFACSLDISARGIVITVSDEGAGFDWRRQSELPANPLSESGRGLRIYAVYAHTIQYNDTGNRVVLTRYFTQGANDE